MSLSKKTAVVGIGATEFSKDSGRSEMRLAVEAILAALDDAGLAPADVDGLTTFTMDNCIEGEVWRNLGGGDLKLFSRVHYGGGGAGGIVLQAVMAIMAGVAEVVVCYRSLNERSGRRFGQPTVPAEPTAYALHRALHGMHGLQTPAAFLAVGMRRYMLETGATTEDFANVALAARKHAATNPKAWYYQQPISRDDYFASPMVADPLRRLDCCQESDGAVALVITSADRARSLHQPMVYVKGAAQALTSGMQAMSDFYGKDIVPRDECALVAQQIYTQARLGPKDIQAAIIYDHFGPTLLPALEGYGFCSRGEAKDFIKNGGIELGGHFPVNTNGGQLGEAYIHGMNGLAEAVRQVRGTAANQVVGLQNILATAGSNVPTSGVIFGAD